MDPSKEIKGYVSQVSGRRLSARNNKYFDIQLQTSSTKSQRLRVMESPTAKRSLFMEKCESKTPIKITGLLSTDEGNMPFFNINFGHQLHDLNALPFLCMNPEPLPIKALKDAPQSDNFVVSGEIIWHTEERTVQTLQQSFGDSSIDEYVETLLSMENIDLEFTKKMIVTKMTSHTDSSAQDMELQPITPAKDNDVIHAPEQTDFIQTESTMLLKENGVILETESIKPAEDNDVIQYVIQEADFEGSPAK
eukprot:gene13176-14525_t